MRPAILLLCALAPVLAAESDPAADASGVTVSTWGSSYLLVTAPGGDAQDAVWTQRLGQNLTGTFSDSPLSEVADVLRQESGCNVVIDPQLRLDDPHVTFSYTHMSLGNVLHWVTQLTGTSYATFDGAIVFSKTPLARPSRTVLYDVSDLTMPIRDFAGPELAFNQTSGGSHSGMHLFAPAAPDDTKSESVDDLAGFVRQSLGKP